MSSQVAKNSRVLSVAVSDQDLDALAEIVGRADFGPSPSKIARVLFRFASDKVLNGRVSMRTIFSKYAKGPIAFERRRD